MRNRFSNFIWVVFAAAGYLVFGETQALSCTALSSVALENASDVIADGTIHVKNDTQAVTKVRKTPKGEKHRYINVTLTHDRESEASSGCPSWFPLRRKEKGRFYLTFANNQSFYVLAQD